VTTPPGQYVPVSVFYDEDDRVMDAGALAELVHQRALRAAARLWQQDGFLTARQVGKLVADLGDILQGHDPVDALVRVGLLRPDDTDPHRPGYWLRSWERWNGTAEQIVEKKEAAKASAAERSKRYRERQKSTGDSASAQAPVGNDPPSVTSSSRRDDTSRDDVTNGDSRTSNSSSTATTAAAAAASVTRDVTPESPPLPAITDEEQADLARLAKAITAAGLRVSWKLNETDLRRLLASVERSGVPALVDYAKRRHRPGDPAHSVKAWLEGWEHLPTLRLVEDAREKPPECPAHPSAGRRPDGECAACRVDRLVEAREAAEAGKAAP
jgi:hypothetical protein